jgi:hypothetical protein
MSRDFLDEIMAERTAHNPEFPQLVKDAIARQDRAQHKVRVGLDSRRPSEPAPQATQEQEQDPLPDLAEHGSHTPPV